MFGNYLYKETRLTWTLTLWPCSRQPTAGLDGNEKGDSLNDRAKNRPHYQERAFSSNNNLYSGEKSGASSEHLAPGHLCALLNSLGCCIFGNIIIRLIMINNQSLQATIILHTFLKVGHFQLLRTLFEPSLSNSRNPVVRPSVPLSLCSSVRFSVCQSVRQTGWQNHLWGKRALWGVV